MLRAQIFVDAPIKESGIPDMTKLIEAGPVMPERRVPDTRVPDTVNFGVTTPEPIIVPPSILERAATATKDQLAHRLSPKTIAKEMGDAVFNRLIPHGATELAHALFLGQSFAPYGYTLKPLEPLKDGADVHGPKDRGLELEKG
jgi:hypothetical protein